MVSNEANLANLELPRPFTILVADDDRGNRDALADILRSHGFEPILAQDGGEAVEIVQVTLVHLVLIDMHMPKLTALLPASLMTADATRELIRQAYQAQVFSVIPKPVNVNVVLHTLTRALTQTYKPTVPPMTQSSPPSKE
jgi:two-component system, response regulator PdtaR